MARTETLLVRIFKLIIVCVTKFCRYYVLRFRSKAIKLKLCSLIIQQVYGISLLQEDGFNNIFNC